MSKQNNKPIKSFKASNVEASVWRQEVQDGDRTVTKHSVCIQKQFRKKGGGYEKTDYYFRDDLPKLRLVVDKAFEFIALNESPETEDDVPV